MALDGLKIAKFRSHVRARRLGSGWTQKELADMVGTTGSVISAIETGGRKPGAALFARLLVVLALDASDYVSMKGQRRYQCQK